mgnify:CR=1 FL=1
MKKKIFSILLSLCMVLTMIPVAAGTVWAEDEGEGPIENVTFGYAYDVQRSKAYPKKGEEVTLSGLANPIVPSGNIDNRGTSNGAWTLTKAGTYAYMVASNKVTDNLKAFVPQLSSNYQAVETNKIIIHELKNNGEHIAYGVVVAYGTNDESGKYALFQGDTLSGSGAGYFLTERERHGEFSVRATALFTENLQSRGINLELTNGSSFEAKNEGYGEGDVETKTVTVTNTGAEATGDLTVALSGDNANCFEILPTESTISSINRVGGIATFSIKPIIGLSPGTYTAKITVGGKDNNGIEAQSLDIRFTVNSAVTKTLTSIAVTTPPTKTTYTAGDNFDSAGMVVTATYSDSSTSVVPATVTDGTALTAGKTSVTISYTEGGVTKTATQAIMVNASEYSITVTDGKATQNEGTEISKASVGTTVTLTANAAPSGKVFDKWVVENGNIILADANSATTTFTMPAGAVSVEATYKDVPHTGGGSHSSSIQKPTIIAGEGAETSLSILGTNLTIKVTEGYELTDVILNGVSKGKVTELTGLRTGDKVEVKTEKKQEKPSKEEIIAALDSSKLVARSKLITLENGKKAVRVTWYDQNGNEINFDGIEVYRSVKRYKGYGLEPFYTTKGDKSEGYYVNTKDLKEGTTYYYKVRGYVTIDGQKYYTDYSDKAWRTIK